MNAMLNLNFNDSVQGRGTSVLTYDCSGTDCDCTDCKCDCVWDCNCSEGDCGGTDC